MTTVMELPEVEVKADGGGRRGRKPLWRRGALVAVLLAAALMAVIAVLYLTVPKRNNDDPQVDALLVLGSPTGPGGKITSTQQWRMDEAIREYRAGRAQHIVISGGQTRRGYIEAVVMGMYALRQGVPAGALIAEPRSMTTVENIRNSQRILNVHGWKRVEVISSAEHLPRAALILEHTDLLWSVKAAPTPGVSRARMIGSTAEEAIGTAAFRVFGLRAEPMLHAIAVVQRKLIRSVLPEKSVLDDEPQRR